MINMERIDIRQLSIVYLRQSPIVDPRGRGIDNGYGRGSTVNILHEKVIAYCQSSPFNC